MDNLLSKLTLEGVLARLVSGEGIEAANGSKFSLASNDNRALLSFYWHNRSNFWNPDKAAAIQEKEVDRLLEALDKPITPIPSPAIPAITRQRWKLARLEAHRFRGLHRHCRAGGKDPDEFHLDFSSDVSLFRGFNGAGKSSLLSAISWCLTEVGYQSQGLPKLIHEPIDIHADDDEDAPSEHGHEERSLFRGFVLPPLVPIPSKDEMALVGNEPKHDTWVKLVFQSLDDGREIEVQRRLVRNARSGKFETIVTGVEGLGLSSMALRVGTVMPAIAAAMRFDDQTDLSNAISILTGLRPLASFGERSKRLYDRLTDKFPKRAEEEREASAALMRDQIATLHDLAAELEGIPSLADVKVANSEAPDDWKLGIKAVRTALDKALSSAKSDAELILGKAPTLASDSDITRFERAVEQVTSLLTGASLRGLPAMNWAARLSSITVEDITRTKALIASLEEGATKVAHGLQAAQRAERLRLHALVAKWHEENHPDKAIDACPVCSSNLVSEPALRDDALGVSIKEALESARRADASVSMTAAEWEARAISDFEKALPLAVSKLIGEDLPASLSEIYEKAFARDLFAQAEMPPNFRSMSRHASALWQAASQELPPTTLSDEVQLPPQFAMGKLPALIAEVQRIVDLATYRTDNQAAAQSAVKAMMEESAVAAEPVPANERPLKRQLADLRGYIDVAKGLATLSRQLQQIQNSGDAWATSVKKIALLKRAAIAVQPFGSFPELVHEQVDGLISALNEKSGHWVGRMYQAPFIGGPSFAGINPSAGPTLSIMASHGEHRFEAHHVMNASALRAYLWGFVIALWQELWEREGGIACLLMDDPQDLFDPANVANLAATIPLIMDAGAEPVIASNDFGFLASVEGYVRNTGKAGASRNLSVFEFSPLSQSKCTAHLAPIIDEIRVCADAWKNDENNVALAKAFVLPLRVRIELKLWDLLANEPDILHEPALSDLIGRIQQARNRGEVPFNEEPFARLLSLAALKQGAGFRDVINKAHHNKADQITPSDALVAFKEYREVLDAIDACWVAYARFMRRLPSADFEESVPAESREPIELGKTFPVIGRLAAREPGGLYVSDGATEEALDLSALGDVTLFGVRASTLGLVALAGQTVIASMSTQIKNGDLAIVKSGNRIYARRVGLDRNDTARVVLESIPASSSRVPPTHFVSRTKARIDKIVGVLFDDETYAGDGEAAPVTSSKVLAQVTCAARVVGDSAYPVANDGDYVLLSEVKNLASLEGRIVAVRTRTDLFGTDSHAYLKRLGKPLPTNPQIYYLENVGLSGEGVYLQIGKDENTPEGVERLDKMWKVVGVVSIPKFEPDV